MSKKTKKMKTVDVHEQRRSATQERQKAACWETLSSDYRGLDEQMKHLGQKSWSVLFTVASVGKLPVRGDTTLAFLHGRDFLSWHGDRNGYTLTARGWAALYWETVSRMRAEGPVSPRAVYDGLTWKPGPYGIARARLGRLKLGVGYGGPGMWVAAVELENGGAVTFPGSALSEAKARSWAYLMAMVFHHGSRSALLEALKATLEKLT